MRYSKVIMYKEILDKISEYDSIVIFGHVNPDGDCYGSQIGLKNAILDNFNNKKDFPNIVHNTVKKLFDKKEDEE